MILYKENPNLKLTVVTTINGEKEYRKNCRKIKDKFYIKGKDCIEIDERWYITTSKHITFDYEKQMYVLIKDTPLVYGLVGLNLNGTPLFGYFTENKYFNVWTYIEGYGKIKAINEKVLEESGFIENISEAVWYLKKTLSPIVINKFSKITSQKVFREKGYNIEDNNEEFKEKIDLLEKFSPKISVNAIRYGKMLGETSFGCEIETAMGFVPDNIQYQTGTIICRDGSIDNAEYVTVPYRGAKGLVSLKNLSQELIKRTTTDIKCSFHIHLGTLPKDRLFIVALYALAIRIQDEIFSMFPHYKVEWEGIKTKDYNQKVKKLGTPLLNKNATQNEYQEYIDNAYYRIFTWLNEGVPPDDRFNRNNHRHQQTAKWNRKQRYYWLNFMNLFFSERNTAEFRLHHCTLNGQKMVNWLFICNAIVRYAEKNPKIILTSTDPIKIEDVLNYYAESFKNKEGKFLSEYLIAYFKDRQTYFQKKRKAKDFVCQEEMDEDKKYVFDYQGTSWLF